MKSIFDCASYREYLEAWILNQPKNGHGILSKLAQFLNVSTTLVSQILRGDKNPSLEIALEICEYLNLSDSETDFFILLVEYEKAGSLKLKGRFKNQIKDRIENAKKIENRIKKGIELSEEEKYSYYSDWVFTACRLLTSIPEVNTSQKISELLNVNRDRVDLIIKKLIEMNLIIQKNGTLTTSATSTHIGSNSTLVNSHHKNWRMKGFEVMLERNPKNIFYTGPVVLSFEAKEQIHSLILNFISEYRNISGPSNSELLYCLNIDWFKV